MSNSSRQKLINSKATSPLETQNKTPYPTKTTWLLCLGLLAFVLILYLPFLGNLPLIHEEPRRALIAQSMLQTGEFFVPMLLNEIYTAKPPLFNWLIVASSLPEGVVNEFSARLPSVIFLVLTAVIMVVGMRRYLSLPGQIFLGFAILLTPELMAKANIAEIEIVFVFLVTLSIWSWYWLYDRGYAGTKLWTVPLIIVAASFLTKREPSLVFFYFSIVPFLFFEKKLKMLISFGHIAGFLLMCLIIGSWLGIMVDSVGVNVLLESLQAEVVSRGLTSSAIDYVKHITSYPLQLLAALLPFGLLLIPLYQRDTRKLLKQRYGNLYLFCVLAVLVNLPLYWFRGDAAVRYFLPMFPTILVLITLLFEQYYQQLGSERFTNIIRKIVKIFAVILVLLSTLLLITSSIPFWPSPPALLVPWFAVLVIALPVIGVAYKLMRLAFRDSAKVVLPVLIGNLVVLKLLYFSAILPYKIERIDENRNGMIVMQKIDDLVPENAQIQVLGHTHYALWYYAKPGLLRVPGEFNKAQYKGYIMAYDTDPTLMSFVGDNNWREIAKTPYRDVSLILGELR